MASTDGKGPYLLLVYHGTENWSVHRFQTETEVTEAITRERYIGDEYITAEERPLQLGYADTTVLSDDPALKGGN